jgi:transcriptional antiterminator NusG
MSKHKWYIAFVQPKEEDSMSKKIHNICEKKFGDQYQDMISEMYIPKSKFKTISKGEVKESERLTYPGYLFIKADLSQNLKMTLLSINGLRSFLSNSKGDPQPMTEAEYADIVKSATTVSARHEDSHSYHIGDRVVLKEGSFQEFEGMVSMVYNDEKMLDIKVFVFGKEVDVSLPFLSVEKVLNEDYTHSGH